ncbi:uncharacterized protein TRAVEDRAFT_52782 [Trametes versicolor FP-101664 SS1]|uniref:uncharacterized protein n=1 Tax=Trametes versicolor (strain FP-101664) TaxID=717944 RepID=UPI000462285A|nr:uncharacterized protein TRAVEDRAFT_52782 [Trametes versicolor FP-101664 SS1]EIW53664.1 hypothetical protein TRAVEDRAFT_52782 [Trametes versicolor FP-101664 SS1]
MATVTLPWDAQSITIIRHDDENPANPPDGHLILYTIAQPEPFTSISSNAASSPPTKRKPRPTYSLPPPPIFAATRFRLPLPSTNDPGFRREILVGGERGLQLSKCFSVGEDVSITHLQGTIREILRQQVEEQVSIYCNGPFVSVERAYFPSEWGQRQKFVRAVHKPLDHKGNAYVTYSFILAHMVEQQHRHWCELSLWDEVDLEPLLGPAAFWAKGSKAKWDSIYIVAIRKHRTSKENHGAAAIWFPELEIRVTC